MMPMESMTVGEFYSLLEVCRGRNVSTIEYTLTNFYLRDFGPISRALHCESNAKDIAQNLLTLL